MWYWIGFAAGIGFVIGACWWVNRQTKRMKQDVD